MEAAPYPSQVDEFVQVQCRCLSVRSVTGKGRLLALAQVEIEISGLIIQINGVRVEREPSGVSVRLPVDNARQALISVDEPIRSALADVVLAAGLEIGVLKERI